MLRLSGFDVHPCKCTQGPQGSALQVSGIVTMQTGAPLDILETNSNVSSIVPQTRNRPDLVGKIRYPKTVDQRFDPTAFADPAPGTLGQSACESGAWSGTRQLEPVCIQELRVQRISRHAP